MPHALSLLLWVPQLPAPCVDASVECWPSGFPPACSLTGGGAADPHRHGGGEGSPAPVGRTKRQGQREAPGMGPPGTCVPRPAPSTSVESGTKGFASGEHLLPRVSSSLQRVVPELRGDGVAHRPPGHPEGPEPHPRAGAASPVHGRAFQGVGPGHHPDGQPEEVSVPGPGLRVGLLGTRLDLPPACTSPGCGSGRVPHRHPLSFGTSQDLHVNHGHSAQGHSSWESVKL